MSLRRGRPILLLNHSYDYGPNLTPLIPITIINRSRALIQANLDPSPSDPGFFPWGAVTQWKPKNNGPV